MRPYRVVGLCALLAALAGAGVTAGVPVGEALRVELRAEWQRELSAVALQPNPSGEPRGAETWQDAAGGVDGVKNGAYGFHTIFSANPWWQVDLQEATELDRVVVYNRQESPGIERRTVGMKVLVSIDGEAWQEIFQHTGEPFGGMPEDSPLVVELRGRGVTARFVRCQMPKEVSFHLDEVEVYPAASPTTNIALNKPADQSSSGRWSTAKPNAVTRQQTDDIGRQTVEVLERARELLACLSNIGNVVQQEDLQAGIERVAKSAQDSRETYFAARDVLRRVALANPLLACEDLLLVKRHPGTFAHMCDQYYGGYARAGGGLFVLEDCRREPRLRDLIGDRLPAGSFLSPDLSYDGTRVAFAFVPVHPDRAPAFGGTPETSYHIYAVNADGTDLRQLTDGPWDEFDPCWLPDGDIVFISARRGGHCRCGARPVPTYTLHRMRADGSGIRRLSSHETNEWHPAIGNDGSILYTRWDYVDRHTNLAHSLWSCRADGSTPMAVYGNYNYEKKPWGEWHPQPVPGSHRLMAVAGAHHGYAYGSLILIDPRRGPDGLEAAERLTPEVSLPEAEGFPNQAYTTPLPLSEDFWLVSYSPSWSTSNATHAVTQGLYLQDRFGNRELIYRDPEISSLNPMPLRPRPRPGAWAETEPQAQAAEGRFVLFNVYDASPPLSEATIRELRIIQALPKTTFVADQPKISAARQIGARHLLGTVPVEADGSAHFTAPAGVPLYFQAVDGQGMAVQSMRSITYLQPGETASCVGCHEPRHTTPTNQAPLALRREPSAIQAGPDGTRPFSYPRLVQPVLDRHCVSCHGAEQRAGGIRLTGDFTDQAQPHTHSYQALATKTWVHWFDSVNGGEWVPRTTPGEFGARKSRLMGLLREGHEGVELPDEDLRKLALWIDLNVPFYGVYEPEQVAAQRAGEAVAPDAMLQ